MPSAPAPQDTSWQPKFERWVDLKEFDFSARYKSVADSNGAHEFSDGQQRGVIDGKFKFDAQGRYGIDFHASSGKSFNWSYADFIGGGNQKAIALEVAKLTTAQKYAYFYIHTLDAAAMAQSYNSGGWSFYVRRLALDVEPIKGVEAQFGALDINRGVASEITSYDNDGYIDGERLSIKRPKNFFFDEASVTYAYIGNLHTPNFFARGADLTQSNYHQFLLRKHAGKRVDASFDYTRQGTSNTYREDALVDVHESRVIDSVRVEFYQRPDQTYPYPEAKTTASVAGHGYAITADKKIGSRLALEAGYASVDIGYGGLTNELISSLIGLSVNGDQYGLGQRVFARPTIKITSYLDASAFYTKELTTVTIANPYQVIWNQQAFNAGLNFDMKKLLFPKSRAN